MKDVLINCVNKGDTMTEVYYSYMGIFDDAINQ